MKYPNTGRFRPKACKKASCENQFIPEAPSQLYCSPKCRGKNSYYLRNYGISEDELAQMKASQNDRCYICGSVGFVLGRNNHTETLAVDHCHKSGEVRKLLCHNCNRALGLFKDSPDILRKAATYIEEHR